MSSAAKAERYELVEIDCGVPRLEVRLVSQAERDADCLTHRFAYLSPKPENALADRVETQAHTSFPSKPGWPLRLNNQFARSPGLAELGDPRGLATIFHERDGTVHALAPDAQHLWNRHTVLRPTFNSTTPAIADLDVDGRDEIMVGVVDLYQLAETGGILPGWPLDLPPDDGFGSLTPIITQFTSGGPLWIVAASVARQEGRIHVIDRLGERLPGWPASLPPGPSRSTARVAVGDVTGDGVANVVAIDIGNGLLFVYDHQGQLLAPFPVSTGGSSFLSAPSLGDLDGDGAAEIIFRRGFRIIAMKGDGTTLPGWPQEMVIGGNFGLALGDVDGDGDLEVMASSINSLIKSEGGVYVWNGDGTLLPGWPRFVKNVSFAAPTIIADVDGDGQGDLIASGLTSSLGAGVIYAWKSSGQLIPGFPIVLDRLIITNSAPLVADIDRDGIADLGVMSRSSRTVSFMHWFDLGVPYRPEGMEWPAEGHDMARTGAYSPPVQPVERRTATVILNPSALQIGTPAAPLQAVVTLPAGSTLVPNALRLVEVDGVPVSALAAYRHGGLANGGFTADKVVFKFDGRTVRDLLGDPGVHRLLFRSDVLGDRGSVMYEAEADLTLH